MLAETRDAIDRAAEAGARSILLVPGGYRLHDGLTREKAYQRMVRGLRESLAYVEGRSIPISTETLETSSLPWCSLGEMLRIFDALPGLKYTHDAGNPLVANEDPLTLYQALQDKVVSVHFKDLGYTEETENSYRSMDGRYLKFRYPGLPESRRSFQATAGKRASGRRTACR